MTVEVLATSKSSKVNKERLLTGMCSALMNDPEIEKYMYTRPHGNQTVIGIKLFVREEKTNSKL